MVKLNDRNNNNNKLSLVKLASTKQGEAIGSEPVRNGGIKSSNKETRSKVDIGSH